MSIFLKQATYYVDSGKRDPLGYAKLLKWLILLSIKGYQNGSIPKEVLDEIYSLFPFSDRGYASNHAGLEQINEEAKRVLLENETLVDTKEQPIIKGAPVK